MLQKYGKLYYNTNKPEVLSINVSQNFLHIIPIPAYVIYNAIFEFGKPNLNNQLYSIVYFCPFCINRKTKKNGNQQY